MLTRQILIALWCAFSLFAQKKPITIDTVIQQEHGHAGFGGRLVWAPDGKHFAFLRDGHIMLYDVAAKSEKELLPVDDLEKAAAEVPEAERFDWQNRRVNEEELQWSPSGKQLLVSAARRSVSGLARFGQMGSAHQDASGRARPQAVAGRHACRVPP